MGLPGKEARAQSRGLLSVVRVVFFGTPAFALPALKSLNADSHFELVCVVTQPDRPSGRSLKLTPTPVRSWSEVNLNSVLVVTSERVSKDKEVLKLLENLRPDLGVVVAFGQILTQEFLSRFPLGCVNIHASLLPRWRGAAPIQRALMAGDQETGVCLQKMVKRLDAGDVLAERRVAISDELGALELHDKLAGLSRELIEIELMDYCRGHLSGFPQDESLVTYAHKIDKAETQLDWSLSTLELHNRVRGLNMGPHAWFLHSGKRVKVIKSRCRTGLEDFSVPKGSLLLHERSALVGTQDGFLELIEVQPESKSKMSGREWLAGVESSDHRP